MNINLQYVEGTNEKLQHILRYNSNLHLDSSLCILLCKSKDRVAAENKNNTVYETRLSQIACKVKAVYTASCTCKQHYVYKKICAQY